METSGILLFAAQPVKNPVALVNPPPETPMAVDIKNLNHTQLNELISKAQVRQTELRKEKVAKLREKINALIKAEGLTFDDVFDALDPKSKRAGTTGAAK